MAWSRLNPDANAGRHGSRRGLHRHPVGRLRHRGYSKAPTEPEDTLEVRGSDDPTAAVLEILTEPATATRASIRRHPRLRHRPEAPPWHRRWYHSSTVRARGDQASMTRMQMAPTATHRSRSCHCGRRSRCAGGPRRVPTACGFRSVPWPAGPRGPGRSRRAARTPSTWRSSTGTCQGSQAVTSSPTSSSEAPTPSCSWRRGSPPLGRQPALTLRGWTSSSSPFRCKSSPSAW